MLSCGVEAQDWESNGLTVLAREANVRQEEERPGIMGSKD